MMCGPNDDMTNPANADTVPCFCGGPFAALYYEDRPQIALGREHASGSAGCFYRPPKFEGLPPKSWFRAYRPLIEGKSR